MRKPHQYSDPAWTELLRKYRDDTLSPDERTQLTELSKQNPLVAEAVEGTRVVADGDTFVTNVAALRAQLRQRTHKSRSYVYRPLQAAAVLLFLLVASYQVYVRVIVPDPTSQEQPSAMKGFAEEKTSATLAKPPVAFLPSFGIRGTLPVKKPSLPLTLALVELPTLSDAALDARVPIQSEAIADVPPLAERESIAKSVRMNRMPNASPAKARARSATSGTEYEAGSATVIGQVFGGEDEPLPGVNVLIKGTSTGTITDIDGQFTLPVDEENATLVFSAIGYTTHERAANSAKPIRITLEPDVQSLSEVVVVGYGTQKRKEKPSSSSAQPLNGMSSFKKYLRNNLRYPVNWSDNQQEVVKVSFRVQTDGSLTDFIIKKGVNQWLNQEAIRVVREGPRWAPAIRNGQRTSQRVTVRVRFKKKR